MPDPKFSKPWHGVPREQISWNPTIIEGSCIGCGTCVTGCSRLVYRFDFGRKKPVVVDPLNCNGGVYYLCQHLSHARGYVSARGHGIGAGGTGRQRYWKTGISTQPVPRCVLDVRPMEPYA